jgi:hypothetical protein
MNFICYSSKGAVGFLHKDLGQGYSNSLLSILIRPYFKELWGTVFLIKEYIGLLCTLLQPYSNETSSGTGVALENK